MRSCFRRLVFKMESSNQFLFLFLQVIISQLLLFQLGTVTAEEEIIFPNLTEDSQHIFLESKYRYSVTLKLHKKENRDDDDPLGRTIDYHVRAPDYSYFGIMAVVQNAYLRTYKEDAEIITDENSGEIEEDSICRDYIQFFKQSRNKSSGKICGSLYKEDYDFNSSQLIGPRVYYSEYGALRLRLHVDKNTFDYDKDDPYLVGTEIVFTAYTVCPNTNVGIRTLKRCSDVEAISCIASSLFCDGKVDCGFENEFALDEMSCFTAKYYKHVIVVIIFVCFLCFLIYSIIVKIKRKSECP